MRQSKPFGTDEVVVKQETAKNLRVAGGDAAGSPTAGTVLAIQGIADGKAVPVTGTLTADEEHTELLTAILVELRVLNDQFFNIYPQASETLESLRSTYQAMQVKP